MLIKPPVATEGQRPCFFQAVAKRAFFLESIQCRDQQESL